MLIPIRWYKVFNDLWQTKLRTLLVVLSIAAGVFAFGVVAESQITISNELTSSYLRTNPASSILHIDILDDRLIKSIKRMSDVSHAEGRGVFNVRINLGSEKWQDMTLFVVDDFNDITINIINPEQGDWPPPERTILIERKSMFMTQVDVGESIVVEVENGKERTLKISGLAHDMSQPPAQVTGIVYGYVTTDTAEWLALPYPLNRLLFVVAEKRWDKAHIWHVAEEVKQKTERTGRKVYLTDVPEPLQHPVEQFLPALMLIFSALAVLSLFLSAFLTINTISAILTQQTQQIGVMKAIGANTRQIARIYINLVVMFGLLALILAIPLGVMGARAISQFEADQINFDLADVRMSLLVVMLQVIASLLIPVLASFPSIISTSRLTVRETLSDYGLGSEQFGNSRIDRFIIGIRKIIPLSRPLFLSLRNTFRRKGRLIRTLIALTLGGAIFISVMTLRESLFYSIDIMIAVTGFDISIEFSRSYRIKNVEESIKQVHGVQHVESWGLGIANPIHPDGSKGDDIVLFAPPANTNLLDLDITSGRWLVQDDDMALVVTNSMMEHEPYLTVGNDLILDIGDEEFDWQIVGVSTEFKSPIAPTIAYVNYPYFAKIMGESGRTKSVRVVTDKHDSVTHARMAQAVETQLKRDGLSVKSNKTRSQEKVIFHERFNILTGLLMTLSLLMAIVGGLGLMGTMTMNVLERSREIGVMRAIGAENKTILQIFMVEGFIIGMLAWLGAAIVSMPLSRLLCYQVGIVLVQMPLFYTFSFVGLGIWLAVVIGISGLASFLPAYNAAHLSVRETLTYD